MCDYGEFLEKYEDGWMWYCPACNETHGSTNEKWTFDGNFIAPTFSPSFVCTTTFSDGRKSTRCHTFIKNGVIEYLDDCTHEYAGKIIPMQPFNKNS